MKALAGKRLPKEGNAVAPTMRKVAELAEVSISTVSRVLNGNASSMVSASTRQRVLDAVRELNYHPNRAARTLATGLTYTVVYVAPAPSRPFYAESAVILQELVAQDGYNLIIRPSTGWGKQRDYMPITQGVDGAIAHDLNLEDPDQATRWRGLARVMPLVLVNGVTDAVMEVDRVDVDLACAVETALEHLWDQGCRRIAHFTKVVTPDGVTGARAVTYLRFMRAAGQEPMFIPVAEFSRAAARQAMREYVTTHAPPDAILCHNDDTAIGVYRGLVDVGLRVPEDVGLVGCDDIEDTEYLERALSTITQPVAEMISLAWQFLKTRLHDLSATPRQRTLFSQFVARESSLCSAKQESQNRIG